ncbi:class I SAM-dependent methyltransferase [Roseateles sp. GG27B]
MPTLYWPLSALLRWAAAWGLFSGLRQLGLEPALALAAAALGGSALALLHQARWRRLIVAGGFPLSMLITGAAAGLPAWLWLLPLLLLALAYPRRTWGDAPLFPTPRGALLSLRDLAPLTDAGQGARLLDAGCGLGAGLRELRRAYPQARIEGIEWSGLLAQLARWRCPWADIARGDLWSQPWQPFALVYVFQRPETMARVWDKACAEMGPDSWLISLDFAVPEVLPLATAGLPGGHSLWVYRPARAV